MENFFKPAKIQKVWRLRFKATSFSSQFCHLALFFLFFRLSEPSDSETEKNPDNENRC